MEVNSIGIQLMTHNRDFKLYKVDFDLESIFINKPNEALWTSSLDKDNKYMSAWIEWASYEDFILKECLYKIVPKKDIRIFEIDGIDDLVEISTERIPDDDVFGSFYQIDFRDLKHKGFDGVHLTTKGNLQLHNPPLHRIMIGNKLRTIVGVNGWDCESSVWFNTEWIDDIVRVTDDISQYLDSPA